MIPEHREHTDRQWWCEEQSDIPTTMSRTVALPVKWVSTWVVRHSTWYTRYQSSMRKQATVRRDHVCDGGTRGLKCTPTCDRLHLIASRNWPPRGREGILSHSSGTTQSAFSFPPYRLSETFEHHL